jgi:hypothetical protein
MSDQYSIHYALQTCDVSSFQGGDRFASKSRTEISKKCILSFLESVNFCTNHHPNFSHNIIIFKDRITNDLNNFITNCVEKYSSDKIKIEVSEVEIVGIRGSIESCYKWLRSNGKHLVYQVQDDYLFSKNAISCMLDILLRISYEAKSTSVVFSYNDPILWQSNYKNEATPRCIFLGKEGYWIQVYDASCTFLTTHDNFCDNWDLFEKFFELTDQWDRNKSGDLENKSLNYMFIKRGILGITPINSVAHHLQTDPYKDPYIDYKPIWDNLDVNFGKKF